MKAKCPRCSEQIPSTNINLNLGWGKCDRCNEIFPFAELVQDYPSSSVPLPKPERPFNSRVIIERTPDELSIKVPALGFTIGSLMLIGFMSVWLGGLIFGCVTAIISVQDQELNTSHLCGAAFTIPFWFVGLGLMSWGIWTIWGKKSVRIDREGMQTRERCLLWSRTRNIEFANIQHARQNDPKYQTKGDRAYGAEIVYRVGSFVISTESEDEERWLIAEINNFLASVVK